MTTWNIVANSANPLSQQSPSPSSFFITVFLITYQTAYLFYSLTSLTTPSLDYKLHIDKHFPKGFNPHVFLDLGNVPGTEQVLSPHLKN